MDSVRVSSLLLVLLIHITVVCYAADPFVNYKLTFSYITASPLGVPQQVIAVNDQFPGPTLNATTNYNVEVKVHNDLDEDFLLTWPGIQMRRNSWQDGVLGLIVNNRAVIPIPFLEPYANIVILIGDWYIRNHTALRNVLDEGKELGVPDGVLINGKGPYQYNATLVPSGIKHETINVEPGKTYRVRVHHVGISTSLNFRIQSHNLLLAETEGYYTAQQNYTSMDIHVGQSYSFLLTMDQNASTDYYIVASARFVNASDNPAWDKVTGVAVLHYSNSKGTVSGPLPDPPNDMYDKSMSMNQAMSVRQNGTASGARPNPQGSFHYGSINVSDVYQLRNTPPVVINGKLRALINGISFRNPATPIRLADQFNLKKEYTLDFPNKLLDQAPRIDASIINATYKGFIEIIFQNNDTVMQSYHLDGYSFFVVGMAYGDWTENSRGSYNRWDAISRSTVQVYPGGWTAVFVSLDNIGVWNLRAENLDRWYLGQETYLRIINPDLAEANKTELGLPDNVRYCGALKDKQKEEKSSGSISYGKPELIFTLSIALLVAVFRL